MYQHSLRSMMKKIFDFSSQPAHYRNKVGFLWCSDRRFRDVRRAFEEHEGMVMADPIIIPGGVRSLVEPRNPRDREFILEMIELLKGHGFTTFFPMAHDECAACDGRTDRAYYESLLVRSKSIITERIPDLAVRPLFADFEGLHEIE